MPEKSASSPGDSHPGFASIVRRDETWTSRDAGRAEARLNNAADLLFVQSGLRMSPEVFLMLAPLGALALGGLAFIAREDLLLSALCAALGALLPIAWAIVARARRTAKMLEQLPEMVDELARTARTGRSIEQCFARVARSTAAPLGDELRLCAGRIELGLDMKQALAELPRRTGLVSLRILVMALVVHVSSGGDLVVLLERLSRTIRDRMQFLGRLRAATAASRATAILMIVIPPVVLAFFAFRDPEYFSRLLGAPWGRGALFAAVVLDIVGVVWVLRVLQSTRQS